MKIIYIELKRVGPNGGEILVDSTEIVSVHALGAYEGTKVLLRNSVFPVIVTNSYEEIKKKLSEANEVLACSTKHIAG